ncbi:MAG TPA: CRISPR-associated endonuclease Cas2 [Vicinamibacterales bacterium]
MRKTYLVCYDICDDKRLAKVHKTMRVFGDRLQYSVFECQLTKAELSRCRYLLGDIINHDVDQVIFVDLGPVEGRGDRVITALGKAYTPFDSPCIIVSARENE